MDNRLEFIRKMTFYFSNFDENFMEGYISVIKQFYNDLLRVNIISSPEDIDIYFDKIEKIINENKGIPTGESINKVIEFFRALNPKYEQMAMNIINESAFDKGKIYSSKAYNVFTSNNVYDASIIVHEITHSFVVSKEQSANLIWLEENYSSILHIISEISSYVAQLLFYDFCEAKEVSKQNRNDMIFNMLVIPYLNRKIKFFEKDKKIFEILSRGEAEEHLLEVCKYFHINSSLEKNNSQLYFTQKMANYSHTFGFMVASYIYQQILENPINIKMWLGLEKAQSTIGNEEATLKTLESLGIPCFKDGKISLDDECVSKLSNALFEVFNICLSNSKQKENSFFEKYPAIDDQLIHVVNKAFEEISMKL